MLLDPPRPRHLDATNVLVLLLAVAIALGTLLLFLVLRPAGAAAAFTVSDVTGTTCPSSGGAPACFGVTVRNTGREGATVRCEVAPAAGTTAAFLSGGPVYTSATQIAPGAPLPLTVKVDVTDGADSVYAPNVSCAPA